MKAPLSPTRTPFDFAGFFLFSLLFSARMDQGLHGSLAAWLLAAQSGVVAILFMFRKRADRSSSWPIQSIAWTSVFTPLVMTVSAVPYLSIPGLLLSIWALAALGRSFSISPSDRGIVKRGPYRFLRHPMYAGELLSMGGACISSSSLWNWMILAVFGASIYMRIIEEESLLDGYYLYTRETKWRLLPGVW